MKTTRTKSVPLGVVSYGLLLVAAAFSALPFLWMFSTAIKTQQQQYAWPPIFIPKEIQWQNFAIAWNSQPFARYYLNTAFMTLAHLIGGLFLSSTAGFAFAKYEFFAKRFLFGFILAFLMIPSQVTLVPSYMLINHLGWVDTYTGLIVPGLVNIFGIFLVRQYLQSVPDDLLDAARMDGARDWRIYWTIILPLIKPALATLAIFIFTGSWNAFMWPLVVADSQRLYTIQVGIAFFTGPGGVNHALPMAIGFLSLLPVLLVFVTFQKYFVSGIALTGMKG